jgi:hypothetical protein
MHYYRLCSEEGGNDLKYPNTLKADGPGNAGGLYLDLTAVHIGGLRGSSTISRSKDCLMPQGIEQNQINKRFLVPRNHILQTSVSKYQMIRIMLPKPHNSKIRHTSSLKICTAIDVALLPSLSATPFKNSPSSRLLKMMTPAVLDVIARISWYIPWNEYATNPNGAALSKLATQLVVPPVRQGSGPRHQEFNNTSYNSTGGTHRRVPWP